MRQDRRICNDEQIASGVVGVRHSLVVRGGRVMFCGASIDLWRRGSRLWSCQTRPADRPSSPRRHVAAARSTPVVRRRRRSINIRSVCLFSLYGHQIQSNLRRSNDGDGSRTARALWPKSLGAFFLRNLLRLWSESRPAIGRASASVFSRVDRRRLWGDAGRTSRPTTYRRYGFLDVLPSVKSFVTIGAL